MKISIVSSSVMNLSELISKVISLKSTLKISNIKRKRKKHKNKECIEIFGQKIFRNNGKI